MLNKKAAAEILYREGIDQKEIARMLGISEQTISRYVTAGSWRKKRIMQSINRQTSEEDALNALAHQTRIIRLISEKLSEKVTDDMTVEELKECLIPKGEIDAVQKLFTTVKGKEMEWSGLVKVLREFSQYLKDEDVKLAAEVVLHIDNYINFKRKTQ